MPDQIKILAPAKVNWFLEIKGKRDDGFHEIETVMQTVNLFDELLIERIDSPEIIFSCDWDLGDPKNNLVYRAAELFRQEFAPDKGAKIHLIKNIPHGAGLGGGSSDAANAMIGLNKIWSVQAKTFELERLVGNIGSDCAFFIEGGTSFCTSRGEAVAPMPDVEMCDLVLLYPDSVCSTREVYSNLAQALTFVPQYCYLFHDFTGRANRTEIASSIFNRLQKHALEVSAHLADIHRRTDSEQGVLKKFVSGSGSTIAFLMEDSVSARVLAAKFENENLGQAYAVQTLERGTVWN